MIFGSRKYESENHERNCDVHFKLTLSTQQEELIRFHRKKCGNDGCRKEKEFKKSRRD